jgi:transcriptional regulator with XRE-family HTH domain
MDLEPIYKTIGSIIRRRRRRLELPQTKLAAQLGISRATLANIETGRQRVLVHDLYAFADALDMKLSELLPQAVKVGPSSDWTQVPMPTDLKPQQKEQIASLIGRMTQASSKPKPESDIENVKTHRRIPR